MMTQGWGHQFCNLPLSGYLFQRIYISWLITVTRILTIARKQPNFSIKRPSALGFLIEMGPVRVGAEWEPNSSKAHSQGLYGA
jgi:hypothetical protein